MSCKTTNDPNKEFNGNVKELKEFNYKASEKFGEPAVDELLYSNVSEYDSDGKIIKVENTRKVSKFEYNDKGQEVKKSLFDKAGKLIDVCKSE